MNDLARGRSIFEGRIEYPLPKVAGTRDYIFNLVPADDPYAKVARPFFKKFYSEHFWRKVTSIEDVINFLHGEVQEGRNRCINRSLDGARGMQVRARATEPLARRRARHPRAELPAW